MIRAGSIYAITGCIEADMLDQFDFESEYLAWEDYVAMSEIQQNDDDDDDDDDLSIDIFPIFSE